MLIEVSPKEYKQIFPLSPHPYISDAFIELVKGKVERVVRLVEDEAKVSMGLVAGIKDETLKSPFSAPFGGFHFRHEKIFTSEIGRFLSQLNSYAVSQNLTKIKISLPPAIYHHSFNTKMINSFLSNGFTMDIPEITNWIDLHKFNGEFSCKNSRLNYNQSLRNNLSFHLVSEEAEKEAAYNLVCQNRIRFGRRFHMTFNDFLETGKLWSVDFFHVRDKENNIVAAAIFYRGHPKIVQGIYWGDNEHGRCLRAMDFCSWNLWNHYKSMGFDFIDLGISTECGVPSDGLIRFKEDHDCISGLRLCFTLSLKSALNTTNIDNKSDAEMLCKKAEEVLRKIPSGSELHFNEADTIKLIHEIDVCKVELQLQQEELLRTKAQLDSVSQKYHGLINLQNG